MKGRLVKHSSVLLWHQRMSATAWQDVDISTSDAEAARFRFRMTPRVRLAAFMAALGWKEGSSLLRACAWIDFATEE